MPLLYFTFSFIFAFFIQKTHCNSEIKLLEKEFVAHMDRDKNRQNTVIANWTLDQKKTLCERALNDSRQFLFGFLPFLTKDESVLFNYYSHEPVKLDILQCPADNNNMFIYESRRQRDCFLIMSKKKFQNIRPIGYLYIQYEKCGLGLIPPDKV